MRIIHKLRFKPIVNYYSKKKLSYTESYMYSMLLKKYSDVDTYLGFVKKCNENSALVTDQKITYSSRIEFGSTLKNVKKQLGPRYKTITYPNKFIVLLYKTKIGSYKAKLEMHFYKEKLFFFNYGFSSLSETDRSEITKIINRKYLKNKIEINTFNRSITDSLNNYIIIEDNIEFNISYIKLNQDFINHVSNLSTIRRKNKIRIKKRKERHLYSML